MSKTSEAHASGRKRRLRWLFVAGLLLLLLIVSNLLYASLSSARQVLSGESGELLYAAAFDGFLDEWTLYDGQQRAAVVDGALQLTVGDANKQAWTSARHEFADIDLRVDAGAIAGPVDNAYGVVFALRGGEAAGCELPALILCGLEEWIPLLGAGMRLLFEAGEETRYLAFLISSDGYYSLTEADGGGQRRISDWIPSEQIRQGLHAVNRIQVVGRGGTYRFFINGGAAALCIPHDPGARSTWYAGECLEGSMQAAYKTEARNGRLGLMAQATATGGGGVLAQFDRFIVFQPGAGDAKA